MPEDPISVAFSNDEIARRRDAKRPCQEAAESFVIPVALGQIKISVRELLDSDEDGDDDPLPAEPDANTSWFCDGVLVRSGGILFMDGTRAVQLSDIAKDPADDSE